MRTITSTVLHTLLAATFHRLLHVLCKRGPVVALEGEPPTSDPQRGAAGSDGGAWLGSSLASTPTFNPGERLGRLAEDGAALHSVVISYWLTSTWGLCGRGHTVRIKTVTKRRNRILFCKLEQHGTEYLLAILIDLTETFLS